MSHHASTPSEAARQRAVELGLRLKAYLAPDPWRSTWQLANTLLPLALVWYLMYRSLEVGYWLTLLLAPLAAGLLLRLFVLQHDLGHGNLYRSRRLNDAIGSVLGVVTLIPYHYWRRIHNLHHSHFGNLDRRGPGYITTLTVDEYRALSWWGRLQYRLYRNPLLVLSVGGLWYFVLQHRVPLDAPRDWKTERRGVWLTDLGIVLGALALARAVGWQSLLMVHVPIVVIASTVGVWVFLCQHSFEDVYWAPEEEWDFLRSALDGSSFYKLPKVLQWFTANVGYHHVHHVSPKIPNYRLERCHDETAELSAVPPLTVRGSLAIPRMALWDAEHQRMVSFKDVREMPQEVAP